MTVETLLPLDRFLDTLRIVWREGRHLRYSAGQLAGERIDAEWVAGLEEDPRRAVELEAFVSRFGRMQDTVADKLLPRWLQALAETPGSQIDVLNRAERLGVLEAVEPWLEARKLRNRLVHEYMGDPAEFARALQRALEFVPMLVEVYDRVRDYAQERMGVDPARLPPGLEGAPSSS